MPAVNVNITTDQLVALEKKAKESNRSRSAVLREYLDHKCPDPPEVEFRETQTWEKGTKWKYDAEAKSWALVTGRPIPKPAPRSKKGSS